MYFLWAMLPELNKCMYVIRIDVQWYVQYHASLSPVTTTRVDGPSWRVMETGHPSTRAVNSGGGNRALVPQHRRTLVSTAYLYTLIPRRRTLCI